MRQILLCIAIISLVGCSTTSTSIPDKTARCENYESIYTLYLSTVATRPVSKEESAAAAVAAIFLRMYCGWTGPAVTNTGFARSAVVNPYSTPIVDGNNVEILVKP